MAQVTRATTRRPRTDCAKDLKKLSRDLADVDSFAAAKRWIDAFNTWCEAYEKYLSEDEDKEAQRKKQIRQARSLLRKVVDDQTLFNYLFLETATTNKKSLAYNNYIEGAVNSCIRDMWRRHRGQSVIRRIKAAYWWCYMHCPERLNLQRTMEVMPTDDMIQDGLHPRCTSKGFSGAPREWGQAVVWDEFHMHVDYYNPNND